MYEQWPTVVLGVASVNPQTIGRRGTNLYNTFPVVAPKHVTCMRLKGATHEATMAFGG